MPPNIPTQSGGVQACLMTMVCANLGFNTWYSELGRPDSSQFLKWNPLAGPPVVFHKSVQPLMGNATHVSQSLWVRGRKHGGWFLVPLDFWPIYCPKRRKVVEGRETKVGLNFQFSEMSAYYQSDEKSKWRHEKGNVERCGVKAAPHQRLYRIGSQGTQEPQWMKDLL